jgi:hypothetical protein
MSFWGMEENNPASPSGWRAMISLVGAAKQRVRM